MHTIELNFNVNNDHEIIIPQKFSINYCNRKDPLIKDIKNTTFFLEQHTCTIANNIKYLNTSRSPWNKLS